MTTSSVAAANRPKICWDEWKDALFQFSITTGLTVSAYDVDGKRQLGPFIPSRTAMLLASSGLWQEGAAGANLEQSLALKTIASSHGESERFFGEIRVLSVPLILFGLPHGAIVYGWTFETFATGLGCERIAAQLGLPGAKLWSEARLESPVSAKRMEIYTALLNTLIVTTARQFEAIEKLHQIARMREVFLASVSHELRSPLSAISLRLDLLLRGQLADPQQVRSELEKMRKNVVLEGRLIEDLIDAARTRSGELTIQLESVSLGRVLRDAVSTVQPQAEQKQISLEVQGMTANTDLMVLADAQRLQQLFWNLLFNSVKFTPAGGRIRINIKSALSKHEIEICDTGQGIEADFLPHVFDAFKKQKQDNAPGLGLGLFIAKHIAELHGGTIQVASPGLYQGTTFTVTLPASN